MPSHNEQQPMEVGEFTPQEAVLIDRMGYAIEPASVQRTRRQKKKRLASILFFTTCISMFFAGMEPGGGLLALVGSSKWDRLNIEIIWNWTANGFLYAGSLMLILFAHEMGHYLQARRYGVPASFPYFIPFPISPFGTMGAVILQSAGVADRKSMFDIAISGPLAGLVFAIPITCVGILNANTMLITPLDEGMQYGEPLLMQWLVILLRNPLNTGEELLLNPLLFAGWVGIFITALNLIPIGQLDGGHILYTLIGKQAHKVAMGLLVSAVLLMAAFDAWSYIVMVILLYMMGPKHPPTANDSVPLGWKRILLGWLTLAFIIIGFTPIPITN